MTLNRLISRRVLVALYLSVGSTTALVPVAGKHQPSFVGGSFRAQAAKLSFSPVQILSSRKPPRTQQMAASHLFKAPHSNHDHSNNNQNRPAAQALFRQLRHRIFNTAQTAGYDNALTSGLFGPVKKLKRAYDPITFMVLLFLAALRWNWCFYNPFYWFVFGFCIKWYRARYVFKIPVWDRQPNWNNIITSKEQEKDLKAFTCKNCGSTLFVAKTREFFFEGDTGIGGLGCFSCGAKGKDNFIMDRERIVEDVADMDDYFEYERPLDFVSRAERRQLLKETAGNEDAANQLLVDRAAATDTTTATTASEEVKLVEDETNVIDAEIVQPVSDVEDGDVVDEGETAPPVVEDTVQKEPTDATKTSAKDTHSDNAEDTSPPAPKKTFKPPPPPVNDGDDDLDLLDMDL